MILKPDSIPARFIVLSAALALILRFTISPSFIEIDLVTIKRFPLDQATVPLLLIGSILLSFDDVMTAKRAWDSALGNGTSIKPWLVLGILFSLIYQSIALNATGILKGLAKKTMQIAGSNPNVLMVTLWLFASVLTVATNNDIAIIVMTPLVLEMDSFDPLPFLYMVLFTANTFSMLLISGNPANLIVAEAAGPEGMTSAVYVGQMAIPTGAAGICLGIILFVVHRPRGNVQRSEPAGPPRSWTEEIKLPKYAVFIMMRLLASRVVMGFADHLKEKFEGIPMDFILVVAIAANSFFVDFLVFDAQKWYELRESDKKENDENLGANIDIEDNINAESKATNEDQTAFAMNILRHLPWKLIPFVLSLFVIIGWFDAIGMVDLVARLLLHIHPEDQWKAMIAVGFGSTTLAQFINNQPMTVFVSAVLNKVREISIGPPPHWLDQSYFALAIGANLGGNGTFVASLAVILWRQILSEHDVKINYIEFAKRGMTVTMITVSVSIGSRDWRGLVALAILLIIFVMWGKRIQREDIESDLVDIELQEENGQICDQEAVTMNSKMSESDQEMWHHTKVRRRSSVGARGQQHFQRE